jgi:phage terminase large subunit
MWRALGNDAAVAVTGRWFRWNDDVVERSQWEFRGFVSKGKLTAITQYFSICYFEELSRNEAAICKKLVEYHDSIKERIQPHLASYGIDFFIASDGSVMVIELNPFYTRYFCFNILRFS